MDRVDDMSQDIVKYNTYCRNLSKQQQQKQQVQSPLLILLYTLSSSVASSLQWRFSPSSRLEWLKHLITCLRTRAQVWRSLIGCTCPLERNAEVLILIHSVLAICFVINTFQRKNNICYAVPIKPGLYKSI